MKVLGDGGSGLYSWVASGITWAADNNADVINLSLTGTMASPTLQSAVDYAWSKGAVVVAAAGNSASSSPTYPASYANAMAVAATTDMDKLASFSNFGDWVDVAAPGITIYSTIPGGYGYMSGTSMASPSVAGLAALLLSVVTDTNGNGRLNDEVRSRIQANADAIPPAGIGSGRINAYRAVTGTLPADAASPSASSASASASAAATAATSTATATSPPPPPPPPPPTPPPPPPPPVQTKTFTGTLTKNTSLAVLPLSIGAGQASATLAFSKSASLTVKLLDSAGAVVGQASGGSSPLT